ncbi:MAG TPA: hypothetical protein VFU47_09575, partial [Armatimonadota bacterium]|nr:hypothetical protein [Armatimonadota bacterium]
ARGRPQKARKYPQPPDVSSVDLDWSQRAGQLAITRTRDEHPSEMLVARPPLKSPRVIARFPNAALSKPMWSPEGDALTVEVYEKSSTLGAEGSDLYVLNPTNGQRRKLLKGRNLGWLRHGALLGAEVVGNDGVHNIEAVSRLDVRTMAKRLLSTGVGIGWARMSPSRRWLGWYDEERRRIDLLNANRGHRLPLPMENVRIFGWGRSDRELFYRDEDRWHRAVLQLPP